MPINEYVSADQVVALLNSALVADPTAVAALINNRVPCNATMRDHPTIQCGSLPPHDTLGKVCGDVGMLGIINGLFGIDDADSYGAIQADTDGNGVIEGFSRCRRGQTTVCGTCIHWDPKQARDIGYGLCTKIVNPGDDEPSHLPTICAPQDDDGNDVGFLITPLGHGCRLHEPKPL